MFAALGRIAVLPILRCLSQQRLRLGLIFVAILVSGLLLADGRSRADDTDTPPSPDTPLSQRIDELLQPTVSGVVAADEQDGALLRRLSLDLRGVVPTREELDAFVADTTPERWQAWVDRFLQDPLCDEHLVGFLDRTLMLRRGFTHVDRAAWISYLRETVAANTPLDALSREILYSPWWSNDHRAAQRFYLDRLGDANLITRDIARVFLGRDLQCAQCHDHPLVEDYRQVDYHGLLAFVSAGSLAEVTFKDAEDKDQKVQLYVERAAGDAPFESVFQRGTMLRTGTRLPEDTEQFEDYLRPDQRYAAAAPEGAIAGAPLPPIQSRREQLAGRLATPDNHAFVANWANRLWALVYGQGLVSPLDMIHPENPPAHPKLFALITDGLVASELRIKPFLRQLVMTEAYRRGGWPTLLQLADRGDPQALSDLRKQIDGQVAALDADTAALLESESNTLATYESARDAWLQVQAERAAVRTELDPAEAALLDAKKKHDETIAAHAAAQKKHADDQKRISLLDDSATKLQEALTLAGGEDAELTQSISVAKQRAEAVRAQLPALEKAVSDAQATVDAAAATRQQATENVDAIAAKLQPIRESLLAADAAMVSARMKWSDARETLRRAKQDGAQLKHLVAWLDALTNRERLSQAIKSADESIAAAGAELTKSAAAIEAGKAAVATAEQSQLAANQEVDKANEAHQQQLAAIAVLEKTNTELEIATKLVAAADSLTAAAETLRTEIESRRGQLSALQSAIDIAQASAATALKEVTQRQGELNAMLGKQQQQTQQLTMLEQQRQTQQEELDAVRTGVEEQAAIIASDSASQFSSAGLFPLGPEQLCWSTLRVTGVFDAYVRAEIAELEKQSPLAADADEATKAKRQQQAVRQAVDKLRGNADHYASLFASGPDKTQDDFFASADQALYVANGGSVYSWAGPGNNNPTQVATTLTDSAEVAKVLYWGYLCRQPSEDEIAMVAGQLESAGDNRNGVIQEMAWSLLASAEFRFSR